MKVIMTGYRVYPFHGYGGLEKYPYYLSKYLLKEGINVKVVTPLDKRKGKLTTYEDIKYLFLPPRTHSRKFVEAREQLFNINLARYLKKEKFDVLHSFYHTAYIYLHFRNRVPTIAQPFGIEPFTDPLCTRPKNFRRIYSDILVRHPLRYCMTHADAVASEGDFQIEEILKHGVKKEKIFDLPVGINLSFIKERLEVKKLSREDLGLSDKDFILLSVNRFGYDKGIDYLVDAFNILNQKIKNTKLILIGSVEDKGERGLYQKIMNQVKIYKLTDNVVQLKNIAESRLYDYYAMSDVYISPTLQDDFIMSIQEAMACGLPVVTTGQEFLVKNGINGFVVPKRDPQSIADAVLKLYDKDKCQTMGKISKELAKDYGFESIAKKAIKAYENLT